MAWWDFFRLFSYAFEKGPLDRKTDKRYLTGAGVTQPDAMPDLRNADGYTAGAGAFIRVQNDLIDLTTTTNRLNRYKEYDRLAQTIPEIDMAMTVFADEACISGDTKIATVFHGFKTIEWIEKNLQEERFPVYCYDFDKQDYTIGWAFDPRIVKTAETVKVLLDNGSSFVVTPDHKILKKDRSWIHAGVLNEGDELMPFTRVKANQNLTGIRINQYPRIFTFNKGWIHERQFIDEWRLGKNIPKYEKVNQALRMLADGLTCRQVTSIMGNEWKSIEAWYKKEGFSYKEIKSLSKKEGYRRVIGIRSYETMQVYDVSVEDHQNFCTDSVVMHNCQRDEEGRVFKVKCKNEEVKKEIESLFFHRNNLNFNQRNIFNKFRNLCIKGDEFWEILIDPDDPKSGIQKVEELPADSMYRIETTKGKVVEFQQGKEGPDFNAIQKAPIATATDQELAQSNAVRFTPEQIIHTRIGDFRKSFYPYGVSLIEPARGPAHQIRLMEDSMIVYRLTRAPERRVFYIDIGQLPPFKAESFIERLKDQFRKKKVVRNNNTQSGASAVEERYHAPAQDEDYWLPLRPNSNTRIETLPGACLSLNTKIPLLDGTNDSLEKIIDRWDKGEELWAYSCDPDNGNIVPGMVTWAGITRKNTKVMKVTFDNGESVTCTPDHKFPVNGKKGKIEAKDLEIGDSLIPFRTRKKKIKQNTNDYLQVYNNAAKNWEFVHQIIGKYKNFKSNSLVFNNEYKEELKTVIHHIDYNRFNNNPYNLAWMNWRDHLELHQYLPSSEEQKQKISLGLKNYHESLSEDEKEIRNSRLQILSKKGNLQLKSLLMENEDFKDEFTKRQREGWAKAKLERKELHKYRGKKISQHNKDRFQNKEYKRKIFEKQTIKYPESMFELICNGFKQGLSREDIIIKINNDKEIIKQYVDLNQHIVRKNVFLENGITRDHFDKLIKSKGFSGSRELRKNLIGKLKDRSSQKNEGTIYGKSTINFPKIIFNYFMHRLADDVKNVDTILKEIKDDKELMKLWVDSNSHVKRKGIDLKKGIKRTHVQRMVKSFGYNDLDHARMDAKNYNHTVVSIEYLDHEIDVGTLTIDGNEILHNYHTFAIDSGVFIYNSNLGEIDDTVYFRNKLFQALHFPLGYFSNEDPNATRITLSAQDVKFARYIERLQSYFEDSLCIIASRHLDLIGVPQDQYEDLELKMTPPSDWRELSRAEVVTNRINNANAMKGSQLMPDFDIFIKIMQYTEEEAEEMISRMKVQKLEDLKLQIMAQNPQLLGVGIPGQGEEEIGVEPGGPNPMLSPGGAPPMPGGENMSLPSPEVSEKDIDMLPDKGQSQPLPDPTDEEIIQYDLEIQDYETEQDHEDIDYSSQEEF